MQAIVGNTDNDGNGSPSAYGLQRLTNFNRPAYTDSKGNFHAAVMPAANFVPTIFVSPEDIVWQNSTTAAWPTGASTQPQPTTLSGQFSPVLPGPGHQPARRRGECLHDPGLAVHLDDHGPAEQYQERRVV